MPAAVSILRIGLGNILDAYDESANLADNTNYELSIDGYAPAVAERRADLLANRPPYDDVEESIRINVTGSSKAVLFANVERLAYILRKAGEYWRTGIGKPCFIEYQPQGSDLTFPLAAQLKGGRLILPSTYNDLLPGNEISGVELRIVRSGQWYGRAENAPNSSATEIPNPMTCTFSGGVSYTAGAPVAIGIGNGTAIPSEILTLPAGFLLVASLAANIVITQGETMTRELNSSWVIDSTYNPSAGGVGRFSVSNNTDQAILRQAYGSGPRNWRNVGVFVCLRNNASTNQWLLRAQGRYLGSTIVQTKEVLVGAEAYNAPKVVYLGALKGIGVDDLQIMGRAVVNSAATLDIDYVALINLDDPAARVLAYDTTTQSFGAARQMTIKTTPSIYDDRAPIMYLNTNTGDYMPMGQRGDLWLSIEGTTVAVAWLATSGIYFRQVNHNNVNVIPVLSATRYPAYLTPR